MSGPVVSMGLAVRNGRDVLKRCIESILAQDFGDLDLVVCDNVSDDGTFDLLESYARTDARIKLSANPTNIGSHENMNRVLSLARGTFFRWISSDDWLEPTYVSTCVRALETNHDAIGATTGFTIHTSDGSTRWENFNGEFSESPDPARRFERMLWFFHAGDAKYDPIYGLYRREELVRSHRLRPSERTDWLLCAELALLGRIVHVKDRLAHRTRSDRVILDPAAFRRRLDPVRKEQLRTSPWKLHRELLELAVSAGLNNAQLRRCKRSLRRFLLKETVRLLRLRAAVLRTKMINR